MFNSEFLFSVVCLNPLKLLLIHWQWWCLFNSSVSSVTSHGKCWGWGLSLQDVRSQTAADLEFQVLGILSKLRSFLTFLCAHSARQVVWLAQDRYSSRLLHAPKVLAAQSCLTLFNPMACSLPAPLSMGFSRQEYWSGWPFPSLEDLPNPEIEPRSTLITGGFFTSWTTRKAQEYWSG